VNERCASNLVVDAIYLPDGFMMINESELINFRKTLEYLRGTLLQDIRVETEKLDTYPNSNPDPIDRAEKSLLQGRIMSRLSQIENRLELVEAAINRLDEGGYGLCSKCGSEINPERLKLIPYATLCVKCQARLEAPRY
jgi:RNA polymerase-binding transcription factor